MAKQYYNLEEAAEALGVSTEELNAMRERGELRAFADRGTWKFRVSDIDERAQQGGSASDSALPLDDESDDVQVLLSEQEVGSSDSSFPSTVIGMGPEYGSPSDSDVRLIPEAAGAGSDSDVKLVSEDQPASDSDVKITEPASAVSDSDVRLSEMLPEAPTQQDDSSDFELALGDSGLEEQGPDSGGAGDSLVLGEVADSEISIAPSDSGISLGTPSDSGISLEQPPSAADTETIPAGGGEELLETDFEVPVLDESGVEETDLNLEDSDFDLSAVSDVPSDSGTQVIAVEGDEADAAAATTVADASSALLADVGASDVEAVDVVEPFDEVEAVPMEEAAAARPVLRAQETEWGKLVFAGLLFTSFLALFATFMMLDLVRNLWTDHEPLQITSWIMDQIVGK
jgi:hypothetical protein